MTFNGPDGKPVPDHGKYVTVWQKQGDAWKVIVDCFNSDEPLPPPPATH
jgi:ketosteroid isomerase-like protein